jgi:glutamate--cysteine ligase catalytic subunit
LQSKTRISKSRASSSSVYLSHDKRLTSDQQDQDLNIDPNAKAKLLAGGMDDKLATHFAHLFIRDPLTVQVDEIDARHEDKTCHFDTIQSSVWQTVRFKPPPWIANQEIGWRVEFRSMEIQLTDFENAAFAVFMILLSQTLLHFNISLYIPIPEVDKNMGQAFTHNAVISERFSFVTAPAIGRKKSTSEGSHASSNEWGQPETTTTSRSPDSTNSDAALMTIDEIVNGSAFKCTGFIGLIPLIRKYIQQTQNFNSECVTKINGYLHLVSSRARGTTWTSAKWQRDFVRSHPQYRKDSVVVDEIAYDMLRAQEEISKSNGKVVTGKKMFVEEHVLSSLSEKDKLMDL